MKRLLSFSLLGVLASMNLSFAGATLLPWTDAFCFRNTINLCREDQVYVRDQQLPPRCGCLTSDEYLSAEICNTMDISCEENSGELFSTLFVQEENGTTMIGCGCFATLQE